MIKVGLYCNHFGLSYTDMQQMWQAADRLGLDSAWSMDNSVGAVPGFPDRPTYDAWTMLPALAATTSKIRIGPLVTPSRRRHPSVLAKMSSTLDVISNGRLILAMGCSDLPQLFEPWGQPFPAPATRIAMLDEELDVIKLMWSEDRATYKGKYYHLDDAINSPKPVQSPRPDIWVGISHGRKLMPLVAAKHADGVNIVLGPEDQCRDRLADVAQACKQIGRDYDELTMSRHVFVTITDKPYDTRKAIEDHAKRLGLSDEWVAAYHREDDIYHLRLAGTVDQVGEGLRKVLAQGFDYPIIQFAPSQGQIGGYIDEQIEIMERFAKEIMPTL